MAENGFAVVGGVKKSSSEGENTLTSSSTLRFEFEVEAVMVLEEEELGIPPTPIDLTPEFDGFPSLELCLDIPR